MNHKRSAWVVWRYVREERWINVYLQPDGTWSKQRNTAAEFETMREGLDAGRATGVADGIDVGHEPGEVRTALRVYDEQPRKSWWRRLTD